MAAEWCKYIASAHIRQDWSYMFTPERPILNLFDFSCRKKGAKKRLRARAFLMEAQEALTDIITQRHSLCIITDTLNPRHARLWFLKASLLISARALMRSSLHPWMYEVLKRRHKEKSRLRLKVNFYAEMKGHDFWHISTFFYTIPFLSPSYFTVWKHHNLKSYPNLHQSSKELKYFNHPHCNFQKNGWMSCFVD